MLQQIADTFNDRTEGHEGRKRATRNRNPRRLPCCHLVSNTTRKNCPRRGDLTVSATAYSNNSLSARFNPAPDIPNCLSRRSPHTCLFPLYLFSFFFFLWPLADCYLCFSGLSFDARRDDGVRFCCCLPSSAFARFFFCPIAMYIFSVQSRPALMLPKALFFLSPLLYPASIERESHLKSALLSSDIYIYIYGIHIYMELRFASDRIKYFSVHSAAFLSSSSSFSVDSSFSL